jgi:hypothetical protein
LHACHDAAARQHGKDVRGRHLDMLQAVPGASQRLRAQRGLGAGETCTDRVECGLADAVETGLEASRGAADDVLGDALCVEEGVPAQCVPIGVRRAQGRGA